MGKKTVTRRELSERWSEIEADDDENQDQGGGATAQLHRLRQLKEAWFSDAFKYLIELPNEEHIWCSHQEVMGPLLETFYNYSKDDPIDSPLKLLWARLSREMQLCTLCICQHHQTQQTYATDYEPSSIGPLLQLLQTLDEERICHNLKDINAKFSCAGYDPASDNSKVVCVIFEVLMFPFLLDDHLLANEFEVFIEAVDNCHELTLEGHQQYPGVYALLFLKSRRARSIGYRLAGQMGKLRSSEDLDPLQPLLKKCICFLETEIMPLATEFTRLRVQLERTTVWLGIKALLGFLEPPAFEKGILDHYPIFLSIVLNHISGDSPDFSYAVNCLRLLYEMLGCKLWLRSTLSPSVMRNTLLGQCFHTRNEKSHKEIFDLFQPFLQSLEALQDGEYEEQRRHILYFLLHQVTVSSNFSILMRKKACQIALLIVHHGYKMNPPCPPYECAHIWGPSLIASLKDSSLHISLRQPAFDLVQTVVVSDATALFGTILNDDLHSNNERARYTNELDDDEDLCNVVEGTTSCWDEFHLQSKITSLRYGEWLCIPMLWFDVLVGINPSILPVSFSKAVFWALSRFSMVEAENSIKNIISIENLLATFPSEVSHVLGWKVPSGSDDGGTGKEFKNSTSVTKFHMPLIRTFRKLASYYICRMEQDDLRKHWTWEPMMAESLMLLLIDPNDDDRKISRHILEQFSGEKGLTCGLQFLCSSKSSLEAVFLGLRHALKLVSLNCVLLKFEKLHHFLFVLCKLIKEGNLSTELTTGPSPGTFSSQGGFLRQPDFRPIVQELCTPTVGPKIWENFSCLVSEMAWPSLLKCLAAGKTFRDNKTSQMTFIRLLEILPVIFGKIYGNLATSTKVIEDMTWLHDFINWGRSSLAVVVRYWKQTLAFIIDLLKQSCSDTSFSAVRALEELISSDNAALDDISGLVVGLSITLRNEGHIARNNSKPMSRALFSEEILNRQSSVAENLEPFSTYPKKLVGKDEINVIILDDEPAVRDNSKPMSRALFSEEILNRPSSVVENLEPVLKNESEVHLMYPKKLVGKDESNVIILDDEPDVPATEKVQSRRGTSNLRLDDQAHDSYGKSLNSDEVSDVRPSSVMNLSDDLCEESATCLSVPKTQKSESNRIDGGAKIPTSKGNSKSEFSRRKSGLKQKTSELISDETSVSEIIRGPVCQVAPETFSDANNKLRNEHQKSTSKGLVIAPCEKEDDSWEFSFFKSARPPKSLLVKPFQSGAKRQVIQLNLPAENRSWRVNSETRRFKAPKLDDWYKPILELDYFVIVGLASAEKTGDGMSCKLKEVPVSFISPDEYVQVFQPLVLEEFKAQLHNSFLEMTSIDGMNCGGLSVLSVERIDDFHIVRCLHDETNPSESKRFSESDLVLLTRQPLTRSYHDVHMVGKVERRETDSKRRLNILVIRLYLKNGCPRLNRARKFLVDRSKWCISRLMSITPQLREFQALSSLREIPLLPVILDPSTGHRVYNSSENLNKVPQPLQQVLKSSYNGSQLQAISAAFRSSDLERGYDLTLIQGPPGTGKTRTILAVVSGLLALSRMRTEKRSSANCDSHRTTPHSRSHFNQSAAIARAWQDAAFAKQLHEDERRNMKSTISHSKGRVLICAQSNAAVDELVSRISTEGLHDCNGLIYKPYLVRVGNAKTVHSNSLPFFIDTLVDQRLAEEKMMVGKDDVGVDTSTLRSNLESIVDHISSYEAKRANLRDGDLGTKSVQEDGIKESTDAEIEAKLRSLYDKKKAIYKDLSNAQAQERKFSEEHNALKQKLRRTILKEAEIVVTTLSGCGGDLYGVCAESVSSHKFSSSLESTLFDAVVVDEAAQALEPATLIPLQLLKSRGTRCIMVGDPKQLPATVISNIASKYLFQCSMFERLQRAGHPVFMLTQQYRMHPEICRFPALHFYDGKLRNGEQMTSKVASFHETDGLGPYVFFDVSDGQESHGRNAGLLSLYNECEADAAVEVIRFFKKRYPLECIGGRIGVITPYRSQLSVIRSRFSSALGSSILADIEFNTVDGFQGREVDILVLSTVRAAGPCSESPKLNTRSIGFVADVRRMNVALTRAKLSLWIVGNARTLQTDENWASLLRDAKQRNLIREVRKPYKCIFKSAVIEGSGNSVRKPKVVEKEKSVRKHADLQSKIGLSEERRRKHITSEASTIDSASGEAVGDAFKRGKRRVNEPMNATVAAQKSEGSQGRRSHGNARQRSCERIGNDGVPVEKVKCEISKSGSSQRPSKHEKRKPMNSGSEHEKGNPGSRGPEEGLKSTGGRSGDEKVIESVKDRNLKRKHQREAVDALLSSALISSKKRR